MNKLSRRNHTRFLTNARFIAEWGGTTRRSYVIELRQIIAQIFVLQFTNDKCTSSSFSLANCSCYNSLFASKTFHFHSSMISACTRPGFLIKYSLKILATTTNILTRLKATASQDFLSRLYSPGFFLNKGIFPRLHGTSWKNFEVNAA